MIKSIDARPPLLSGFVIPYIWLILALPLPVCRAADSLFPPQLLAFSAAKEQQAHELAADLNFRVAPEIWAYFKAANHGDWLGMTNIYEHLKLRSSQYVGSFYDPTVSSAVWQTIIEVQTAYEAFVMGGSKYPLAFGEDIIQSIPAGSIYFGGTDSGRGLVTALCQSQIEGKPFYTLTQNALAGSAYLDYLRLMYGSRIYVPTTNDLQIAFSGYLADAEVRLDHDQRHPDEPHQMKPGENVRLVAGGGAQASGQVAVMSVNALLAKIIFDHNTNCEFYVEESFPLDWMYPYLSPHGLIFQLNRKPVPVLTTKMLDEDHAFWSRQCGTMLGDWLKPETSVSNVCAFVDSVYRQKDLSHFTGDTAFVTNDFATKVFSKLRSSTAGLYEWRWADKSEGGDKTQLQLEADYAFRQAYALCPISPEAIFRYVNYLLLMNRLDDAVLIATTSQKIVPENAQYNSLFSQLKNFQARQRNKAPN